MEGQVFTQQFLRSRAYMGHSVFINGRKIRYDKISEKAGFELFGTEERIDEGKFGVSHFNSHYKLTYRKV